MIAFTDDHRGSCGVESICRALPMAPSPYHAHAAQRTDLAWVDRYNTRRLLEPIGDMPPAEAAARSDTQLETIPNRSRPPWRHDPSRTASGQPGAVHWLRARHGGGRGGVMEAFRGGGNGGRPP
jgi:hypothetical protein